MVTFFFLDKVRMASYLEDFLFFFDLKELVPWEGAVDF